MDIADKVRIAKEVEAANLANFVEEAKKCEVLVDQVTREAAAAGALGGRVYLRRIQIRFAGLRSIIDGMLQLRKQLIETVPMLAGRSEVDEFCQHLEKIIKSGAQEILKSESAPPHGLAGHLAAEITKTANELNEKIKRDLMIIEGNAKLSRAVTPPGTINVNAGAGSIISIGNTAHSIVSTLNRNPADNELNHVLKQLAEAIEQSEELKPDEQRDALEHLEFVVTQVTEPPDQRAKSSIIQTTWNNLAQIVGVAANLSQLVVLAEPLLRHHLS